MHPILKGFVATLTVLTSVSCSDVTTPPASRHSSGAALADASGQNDRIPRDFVPTPGGWYHKSCVHELPDRASVDRDGTVRRHDGTTYSTPACQFRSYPSAIWGHGPTSPSVPTTNGWVEDGWAYPDTALFYMGLNQGKPYFKEIDADMIVPALPTTSYSSCCKTVYLFPGLTSKGTTASPSRILQPVLSYGNTGHYGGAYYTMAVWSCDDGRNNGANCYHSTPVTVYPGDSITTMTKIWTDPFFCPYTGRNCETVSMSDLTHTGSTSQVFADALLFEYAHAATVEAYGLNTCSEFPSSPFRVVNISLIESTVNADGYSLGEFVAGAVASPVWRNTGFGSPPSSPICNWGVQSTVTTGTYPWETRSTVTDSYSP